VRESCLVAWPAPRARHRVHRQWATNSKRHKPQASAAVLRQLRGNAAVCRAATATIRRDRGDGRLCAPILTGAEIEQLLSRPSPKSHLGNSLLLRPSTQKLHGCSAHFARMLLSGRPEVARHKSCGCSGQPDDRTGHNVV